MIDWGCDLARVSIGLCAVDCHRRYLGEERGVRDETAISVVLEVDDGY